MRLSELVRTVGGRVVKGNPEVEVRDLVCHSRFCTPGSLFFAMKGESLDGHDFVGDAVARGAAAVAVERPVEVEGASLWLVDDTARASVGALRRFYGSVDRRLFKVGITGTNGKTTVAYLLWQFFNLTGRQCALVGTVKYVIGGRERKALNTTPGLFELWRIMKEANQGGDEALVMEVSSHGLKQGRLGDIRFQVSVFTNLSRDHLDYHGSMEDYFLSKALLFREHTEGVSVVNLDDPWGERLAREVPAKIIGYGMEKGEVRGRVLERSVEGMRVVIDGVEARTKLIGDHNLYNILAAYAVAGSQGLGSSFLEALPELEPPPGRLEPIEGDGFWIFVDYAHTPDALEKVLLELKRICPGRLMVVFGCGGDRDRGKRPQMGRIATQIADLAIITSDNPRTEDPDGIIEDILKGVVGDNYLVEVDRKRAIERAILLASEGDVVLVAGKGHEDYQIVGERRLHFDDREVVRGVLKERGI